MFFRIFPRRQIVVGRRFGTLCQFHLELTQGSETSVNYNLTPEKYPKEHIQYSNHGESLKSIIPPLPQHIVLELAQRLHLLPNTTKNWRI